MKIFVSHSNSLAPNNFSLISENYFLDYGICFSIERWIGSSEKQSKRRCRTIYSSKVLGLKETKNVDKG